MGLFDTVKLKANALAADAERAGRVTAAQARTVVLQNDIRKAERELGHSAFSLIESGAIAHPDIEAATARLREARQALRDKEAEIAGLRRGAEAGDEVAPAPAETAAGGGADAPLSGSEAEAPNVAEPAVDVAPSAARYCEHCGGMLADEDAFCPSCGRPPAVAPTAEAPPAAETAAPVEAAASAALKPTAKNKAATTKPKAKNKAATTKPAAKKPPAAGA